MTALDKVGRGCDYSFSHPGPSAIRAAGLSFVLRYLTGGVGKAITRDELAGLFRLGLGVGFIFELAAADIAGGRRAGAAHAIAAQRALDVLAAPQVVDAVVYFAVDEDVVPGPRALDAGAYFAGVGSQLPPRRVGVYGDSEAFTAAGRNATRYWQSNASAWSHGVVDPRAMILQGPSSKIAGRSVDLDRLIRGDAGIVYKHTPLPKPKPVPVPAPAPAPGGRVVRGYRIARHLIRGVWYTVVERVFGPK